MCGLLVILSLILVFRTGSDGGGSPESTGKGSKTQREPADSPSPDPVHEVLRPLLVRLGEGDADLGSVTREELRRLLDDGVISSDDLSRALQSDLFSDRTALAWSPRRGVSLPAGMYLGQNQHVDNVARAVARSGKKTGARPISR